MTGTPRKIGRKIGRSIARSSSLGMMSSSTKPGASPFLPVIRRRGRPSSPEAP